MKHNRSASGIPITTGSERQFHCALGHQLILQYISLSEGRTGLKQQYEQKGTRDNWRSRKKRGRFAGERENLERGTMPIAMIEIRMEPNPIFFHVRFIEFSIVDVSK